MFIVHCAQLRLNKRSRKSSVAIETTLPCSRKPRWLVHFRHELYATYGDLR